MLRTAKAELEELPEPEELELEALELLPVPRALVDDLPALPVEALSLAELDCVLLVPPPETVSPTAPGSETIVPDSGA